MSSPALYPRRATDLHRWRWSKSTDRRREVRLDYRSESRADQWTAGIEAAKTAVSERYLERIGWIREAAGERFASIELQVLGQIEQVVPNRLEVAAKLAPAFGITPEEALEMPIVLIGTEDEICADLIARRETYGFSYVVVHDMDLFAPIVSRLAGT